MTDTMDITEQAQKKALEQATLWYWSISGTGSTIESALARYIGESRRELDGQSLLKAELAWAGKRGQISSTPCETLVLLVGLSLEPLMQSVCVHKPGKVVLILNEEGYPGEGWREFAHHVINSIKRLVEKGLIEKLPQFLGPDSMGYPTSDQPEAVFGKLVRVLHDEENVVIDVTGGKKSMVTGAFMYAAYSGTRISYVDFENYDKVHRRPYGFSCKIADLANPYHEFALRDWEKLRELYNKYQFHNAIEILDKITDVMKRAIPESGEPIKRLRDFLNYYEKWDRGDFRGAKEVAANLEAFDQPTAVIELCDKWYQIMDGNFANKPKGFYGDKRGLQVYVCDEIERIKRLIEYSEDYRSAFVRAGGVNEVVMLARAVELATNRADILDPLDEKTPSARKVFNALINNQVSKIEIPVKGNPRPLIMLMSKSSIVQWWKKTRLFNANNGWELFLEVRNELMHKYFSVPKNWAEDALVFVIANFEDFLGYPMNNLNIQTKAMSWSCLCELCGTSSFLPLSLRQEVFR